MAVEASGPVTQRLLLATKHGQLQHRWVCSQGTGKPDWWLLPWFQEVNSEIHLLDTNALEKN